MLKAGNPKLYLQWIFASKILRQNKKEVYFEGKKIIISTPNFLCFYRAKTFASKEPETLNWIKAMPNNSVFWDVGANIGLYSLAAAAVKKARTFSFEPSPFNYQVLVKNIYLNKLSNSLVAIPIPLSDLNHQAQLSMSDVLMGGALSTFGQDYGYDGKKLTSKLRFQTCGFQGDCLADLLDLEAPKYIKIDVDGIEHLILAGCRKLLKKVRSVLVEVSPKFVFQTKKIFSEMTKAGLKPSDKRFLNANDILKTKLPPTINLVWDRS